MHRSATFIIVPKKTLSQTPQAFQDYVKTYFKPTKIFGQECFVAHGTLLMATMSGNRVKKGVAPIHSIDLMRFQKGLRDGVELSEWMEQNKDKYFWEFHSEWSDGCGDIVVVE